MAFLCFASTSARSQTFTPSQDLSEGAKSLVDALLPPGLRLVPGSATLSGDINFTDGSSTNASGLFGDLTTIFDSGPASGVILTTGSITNAAPKAPGTCSTAPNCSPTTGQINAVLGSPQLNGLIGGLQTFNASILNFKAHLDSALIDNHLFDLPYVFGSDEYNEFTASNFNDVLGIFVDNVNIATVGSQSGVVSVVGLNGMNDPNLFRNNDPFNPIDPQGQPITPPDPSLVQYNTEYDGLTIPLTASIILEPNVEYNFSIAIADATDADRDSGVFLTRARITPVSNPVSIPGPLPVFGLAAAFGWSRHIRRKLRS